MPRERANALGAAADQTEKAMRASPINDPLGLSFVPTFWKMAGGFWNDGGKGRKRKLVLAFLVALTFSQVGISLLTNFWNRKLFDALEEKDMDAFVLVCLAIVAVLFINLVITNLHLFVKRRLQVGWRQWLTEKLLSEWISGGRQHSLSFVSGEHDNPDQRIAEDARACTEAAVELSLSLLFCVVTLIGYAQVLWMMSPELSIPIGGSEVRLHGWLLLPTILYALIATSLAMLIGRPMTRASSFRSSCEADFRYALGGIREHALQIAVAGAEKGERKRLSLLFKERIRAGWNGQTRAIALIMSFGMTYGTLSSFFPFLLTAPFYIAGAMTLGVLMQTTQAIGQFAGALSWPANNLGAVADWRASVERVAALRKGIAVLSDSKRAIVVSEADDEAVLRFENVTLDDQTGRRLVEPFDLVLNKGERVLVSGNPDGAARLFLAAGDAWPWGDGRIVTPKGGVHFLQRSPYLPRGSVRRALAYPKAPETLSDEVSVAALLRVGLESLAHRLDEPDPAWRKTLATSEIQRFGFARILAKRPAWIFLEDAAASLEASSGFDPAALLDEELPDATLILVDCHPENEPWHDRRIELDSVGSSLVLSEAVSMRRPL
jgi:putative ATP-binding cassette transporter